MHKISEILSVKEYRVSAMQLADRKLLICDKLLLLIYVSYKFNCIS